ncbi:hypothetical protein LCGC14_2691230, partial [marine sediment metagenome]
LRDFIDAIREVAIRIKNIAKNDALEPPKKIYVGILCDGTPHLHTHLIPRYPFTPEDKEKYKEYFLERDGEIEILNKIKKNDLGGYWYVFERERTFYKSSYGLKEPEEKVKILERLANDLRLPKINSK